MKMQIFVGQGETPSMAFIGEDGEEGDVVLDRSTAIVMGLLLKRIEDLENTLDQTISSINEFRSHYNLL